MSASKPLGILVPLAQEAEALFALMEQDGATLTSRIGGRDYHAGYLFGTPCVLTLARVGKVAAATAAAGLIHGFDVGAVLNVGVAGAIAPDVHVGDIVVATAMVQHDLDARPIFPLFEVPLTGISRFEAAPDLSTALSQAARGFLGEDFPSMPAATRDAFELRAPTLHEGLIISGDRFINARQAVAELRAALPDALAVEMESGAMAQLCHDYGVPCAALRIVSDSADDNAHIDFPAFLAQVASFYTENILRRFLHAWVAA